MKLTIRIIFLFAMLFAEIAEAQNYAITSFTISGGGGASSGGNYSLSGTIGQPEAGALSGGNYQLVGGFWNDVLTIPIPGGVTLTIRRSSGTVILAWPTAATGFVLDVAENFSTSPINWTPVSQSTVPVGENQTVTVTASGQPKFYRLRRP
jgi:hypothetical protein